MHEGRTIVVGSEPVAVALPPALRNEPTRLVATVRSARGDAAGQWEFAVGTPAAGARLLLSPAHLDHAFLILDHAASPPTAFRQEAGSLDGGGALQLDLERHGAAGTTDARYRLLVDDARARAWKAEADPRIEWFHVELTSYCNLRCPFCPSRHLRRRRTFLSPEDARVIFGKIAAYARRYDDTAGYAALQRMVYLHVMGEPLLHPRFVECVRAARDAGLLPALFTNATLLNDARVEAIFEAGVAHVTLSVNAATPEGYAALGAPVTLEEEERRIAALLRRRARENGTRPHVDLQFMTAAERDVAGDGLLMTREQAWSLYAHWLQVVRGIDGEAGVTVARAPHDPGAVLDPLSSRDDPSLRLPLASGVDFVIKSGCSFGNAVLPEGLNVVPSSRGWCRFGSPFRQMAICSDGTVSFCNLDAENSVNLGNLLQQSIDDIWSGERMRTIRREMLAGRLVEPLCQRCLGTVVRAAEEERIRE